MSKRPDLPGDTGSADPGTGTEKRAGAASALRDPVGPKSRGVYMRRRILVLVGLLAVIAVVWLVFAKPGSGTEVPKADQVNVPDDLQQSPGPDAKSSDAGEVAACAAADLKVTAKTDSGDYAAGQNPEFSLTVENTGAEPCSADLGTAGMQFEVTSGDDQVWRSVDCQKDPKQLAVILDPGKELTSESVVWNRTRSSVESCEITRDPVAAGGASYHLWATVGGVRSAESQQFLLY